MYLQDAGWLSRSPINYGLEEVEYSNEGSEGTKKKRDSKSIFKQAYGIVAPKNPRQLNKAQVLVKGRVTKYGNYRDTKLISYDDRSDTPSTGDDIFYPGRGFRTRDDLHECIQSYKKFGFSLIIEKSEVKRGRYQLVCSHNTKKKKPIFGSDEEEEKPSEPWNAYVYIYKFKVKNMYLTHNHPSELKNEEEESDLSIIYRRQHEDDGFDSKNDQSVDEYKLDI